LSGPVRRVRAAEHRDNGRLWLRVPAGRCIRHALFRVAQADLVVRDVLVSRRGRALVRGQGWAGREHFRLRARLRRARGQDSGRVSVVAGSVTRR